jgi:hypothetical protein
MSYPSIADRQELEPGKIQEETCFRHLFLRQDYHRSGCCPRDPDFRTGTRKDQEIKPVAEVVNDRVEETANILYERSLYLRDSVSWQSNYMFQLGLIVGGGTSQIQKNIISERGLSIPCAPKTQ